MAFFDPIPNKVRIRDVLREVPGATAKVAKDILRAAPRQVFSIAQSITKQPVRSPQNNIEKFILGPDPVKSLEVRTKETKSMLQELGLSPKKSGVVAPIGVVGSTILDLYPGSSGKGKIFKDLAKETSEVAIKSLLKENVKNLSDDAVKDLIPLLAKEKNPTIIKNLLETTAQAGTSKIDPLLQEARKYKSAEEFVKAQGTPVYRGVNNGETVFEPSAFGSLRDYGFSVSKKKQVAQRFGAEYVDEFGATQNKLLEGTIMPSAKIKKVGELSGGEVEIEIKKAIKEGYDGLEFKNYDSDVSKFIDEITIFNKDVIKTKSQLTDIWERANSTTQTGAKERKFITSIKEDLPNLEKVAGQYIPRSTDTLSIKAANLIKTDLVGAERYVAENSDDTAVAVASELLKHYSDQVAKATDDAVKNSLNDRAAVIANGIARKLTESGRSVQAASILSKLTPEGQVRFAAREIQKYNEGVAASRGGLLGLKKKIPELTGVQFEKITTEMKAIQEMPEGAEKAIRFKKLQDTITSLIPSPTLQKVVAIWKAGLLTGLKTTGINIFSNLSHSITETAKDVPAVLIDSVASLFTGQRTKTLTTRGVGGGVAEGFKKGLRYLKTGYDERDIATKLDWRKVNFGNSKIARALQTYEETVFRVLGSEDQPFYYGAKARSLYDQALAQAKNQGLKGKAKDDFVEQLVQNPSDEMLRYAVLDAETAVFQNPTKLGVAARAIQNIPIVGEFILPFGKTPSAVAMQILNYTPVGAVASIVKNVGKGRFDQRIFSQEMGRALTGTAGLFLGGLLFEKGLMTLDRPGGEREQELWKAEGRTPNSIKVGDKWRTVPGLGPVGNVLLIGGHFNKAFTEEGSPTKAITTAVAGGAKSFTEQTFLKGVNQTVEALNDPGRYGYGYFGNLVSSFIPTIVSDVARANDPIERRTETIGQKIKGRLPGAREDLQPQIDVLGRERQRAGNPLETLIDPSRPSKDVSNPVVQELRRLTDVGYKVSPTLLGLKTGYEGLTKQQNTELWKLAGGITNDKLGALFASDTYQGLPDDKKAKVVETFVDKAQVIARVGMVIEVTNGLSGNDLKTKLAELKSSGLLTQEVFRQYLELR